MMALMDTTRIIGGATEPAPQLAYSELPDPEQNVWTEMAPHILADEYEEDRRENKLIWRWICVIAAAAILAVAAFTAVWYTTAVAPQRQQAHARPTPVTSEPVWADTASSAEEDDAYVAVAISVRTLSGGDGSAGSQDAANRIALSECQATNPGDACLLVNGGMRHGCVAYAVTGHAPAAWSGGAGPTPDAARADALSRLPSPGYGAFAKCSKQPGPTGAGWVMLPAPPSKSA